MGSPDPSCLANGLYGHRPGALDKSWFRERMIWHPQLQSPHPYYPQCRDGTHSPALRDNFLSHFSYPNH